MSRPALRQTALFAALAASLAATAWVTVQDEPAAAPAPARRLAGSGAAKAAEWPAPVPASRPDWPAAEPLARRAWGEPALDAPAMAAPTDGPAAAQAAADPDTEPAPPPFPYSLVGRMSDGQTRAVLDGPSRSRIVAVGDVIDGQWRVEAIEPAGLRLRHLPDGPTQTLPFSPS